MSGQEQEERELRQIEMLLSNVQSLVGEMEKELVRIRRKKKQMDERLDGIYGRIQVLEKQLEDAIGNGDKLKSSYVTQDNIHNVGVNDLLMAYRFSDDLELRSAIYNEVNRRIALSAEIRLWKKNPSPEIGKDMDVGVDSDGRIIPL